MKLRMKGLSSALLVMGAMSSLTSCGDDFNGITINFWHTFGQTVLNGFEDSARDFARLVKENENVDVRVVFKYKGGYDDVLSDTKKEFSTGGNPTIAVAYPDHVADYFACESTPGQYVVDLTSYANDPEIGFGKESYLGDHYGFDDFVKSFRDECTGYAREGMYSVPLLKSTEVMLYNMDLVKEALKIIQEQPDITYDDVTSYMNDLTWEEFMDFCELIVEHKTEISTKLEVPCVYDSDGNLFITQLYQNDIDYAYAGPNPNSGIIGFDVSNSPTAEQTAARNKVNSLMKKYKTWFDKGLFTTKGVMGQYSSYYFTPGKTMFAIGSTGGSGYSFPSSSEFKVGACKVPYNNNNPLYVSQGPTLTVLNNVNLQRAGTNDETVKYAWKFVKYITNEEVNAKQCVINSEGYIPVRESAYNTTEFTNFMKSDTSYVVVTKTIIEDINGRYLFTPVFQGSAALRNEMAGAVADILKLPKNPSIADINAIIERAVGQANGKM